MFVSVRGMSEEAGIRSEHFSGRSRLLAEGFRILVGLWVLLRLRSLVVEQACLCLFRSAVDG